MADQIFERLGQDERAADWCSSEIESECERGGGEEEQRMLQLDGSTGEVGSRGRGGKRRGRLKKLSVLVKIQKKKLSPGGDRGVGVKRKRGRPRKIQETPRILEEGEGKNFTQPQVKEQYLGIHLHTKAKQKFIAETFPRDCLINNTFITSRALTQGQVVGCSNIQSFGLCVRNNQQTMSFPENKQISIFLQASVGYGRPDGEDGE